MTIHAYKSSDPGAPNSLNGTIGSLIPILDACLVNGYGSGGDAKAPAGWTKEFSGVNQAVYRAPTGNRQFFRINDNNVVTGNNNHIAMITGFESMESVSAGTGQWPGVSTHPNGMRIQKSNSNNLATARAWSLFADDRTVFLIINIAAHDSDSPYVGHLYVFGEVKSYMLGDQWANIILAGSSVSDYPAFVGFGVSGLINPALSAGTTQLLHRDHLGNVGAKQVACLCASGLFGSNLGTATLTYPDPVSGGATIMEKMELTSSSQLRGVLRGIAIVAQKTAFNPGDTLTLNGKQYVVVDPGRQYYGASRALIQISGDWEI